jgi:hypothetical protein
MAGLFDGLSETFTGKKKAEAKKSAPPSSKGATVSSSTSTTATSTATSQKETLMSKPSSYFSIKEHTFTVKGRKENKGKDLEVKEYCLWDEGEKEPYQTVYKPLDTVGEKLKFIKLPGLKEMISIFNDGKPEDVTIYALERAGYKDLVKFLKDNRVPVLDFLQFIKDEVEKIPAKPRGRQAGSGRTPKATTDSLLRELVSIMAGLEANTSPEDLAVKLTSLVSDETRMAKAVELLTEKEKENKRDKKGYILLRVRTKGAAKIKAKK